MNWEQIAQKAQEIYIHNWGQAVWDKANRELSNKEFANSRAWVDSIGQAIKEAAE